MVSILLADDDKATRDLVKRMLESEGHQVDIAADGTDALDKLASGGRYNVLVSDVHMPGLDGLSLAARAAAMIPGLSVMLMSGFPEELAKAESLKGVKVATLTKPFTLEQAKAAVRGLIGQ